MGRRDFVALLGGAAAAWPLVARAQQATMPVIGFLHVTSLESAADRLRAFRQGLKEIGFVEGENVAFEHRTAEDRLDRLPELASQLLHRPLAMIAATSIGAASASKAATTTVPVVFIIGDDPVRLGLVGSLSRPGGNLTGVNFFSVELAAKRLELLREVAPAANRVAVLVNRANPANTDIVLRDLETATGGGALQIRVLHASTSGEIDVAFASLARERVDAIYVGSGPPFSARPVQVALQGARSGLPTIYPSRNFAEAGGLMS